MADRKTKTRTACRDFLGDAGCEFGDRCRFEHAEELRAEFVKKGGKHSSVCRYGSRCRSPETCPNLHSGAPARPGRDRAHRTKGAGPAPPALTSLRKASRLLGALYSAEGKLADLGRTMKDPAITERAKQNHLRLAEAERLSAELLKFVQDSFGPQNPLPADDSSAESDELEPAGSA